jgi:hypothetical protein
VFIKSKNRNDVPKLVALVARCLAKVHHGSIASGGLFLLTAAISRNHATSRNRSDLFGGQNGGGGGVIGGQGVIRGSRGH